MVTDCGSNSRSVIGAVKRALPNLALLAALLPLALYAWLGQYTRPMIDDYYTLRIGRELGAWEGMLFHYQFLVGRIRKLLYQERYGAAGHPGACGLNLAADRVVADCSLLACEDVAAAPGNREAALAAGSCRRRLYRHRHDLRAVFATDLLLARGCDRLFDAGCDHNDVPCLNGGRHAAPWQQAADLLARAGRGALVLSKRRFSRDRRCCANRLAYLRWPVDSAGFLPRPVPTEYHATARDRLAGDAG